MLFPTPKLSTVFASRWKALAFAASVLATAYCVAGTGNPGQIAGEKPGDLPGFGASDAGSDASNADGNAPAKSPWAADSPHP